MQIANVMVALGGEKDTTVPKYGITVSEIQVLRGIHGEDAVFDIEPTGSIEQSDRDELARIRDAYKSPDGDPHPVVKELFPNSMARAFRSFDELGLDESLFKPLTRATAPAAKPEKKSKKAEKPVEAAPEGDGDGGLFDN